MCISEYRAMRDVSHKAYLIHRVSFTETQNVQALGRALTHGDALLADTHDTPAPKDVSHIQTRRKPTSNMRTCGQVPPCSPQVSPEVVKVPV